jgi:5-methylcytosine-specific restriction endonuclease McrA
MNTVIVVNPQLEYWGEISFKKAMNKLANDKATVLAYSSQICYTHGKEIVYSPLVIQLRRLVIVKWKSSKVHFSHEAVYDRDDNICQYWHTFKIDEFGTKYECEPFMYKCTETDRTIDHVLPKSRNGKKNDFKNTVCACRHCNEILKRNNTPAEAGLKLLRTPTDPRRVAGDRMIKHFAYNPTKESHKAFAMIRPDLIN